MTYASRLGLAWLCLLAACGGGGGGGGGSVTPTTTALNNVMAVSVSNWSPPGAIYIYPNQPLVSVTVCVPGTSTCQTIDHVLLDTGSYGLRLMRSALSIGLPQIAGDAGGNPLVECTQFASGYTWGPVQSASVQLAGETPVTMPIQVIDGTYQTSGMNALCAPTGGAAMNTPATFGSNGVLGIGALQLDCGNCTITAGNGAYFACDAGGTCTGVTVPLANQVQNPVGLLLADNNGVVIELPAVPAGGQASASGSAYLGIATQSNNATGAVTRYTLDALGYLSTTYNAATLSRSFIDSGSNGLFFDDASLTQCATSAFYCPTAPGGVSRSATITGLNAAHAAITFTVGNADAMTGAALPALAGTLGSASSFDWGLPFFYGRRVTTALEGRSTPLGAGPYVAF